MSRSRGALMLARQSRSQDEIAEKVGVSRVAVSKWLNGQSKPTPPKRGELAVAYEIPEAAWDEDAPSAPVTAAVSPPGAVPAGVIPRALMLEGMVLRLMSDTNTDDDSPPLERAKVMRECSGALRQLEEMTKTWERIERCTLTALQPFPEAAKAVQEAWRKGHAG